MYQSRWTAKNSWWWAERLAKTCRVVIPVKLEFSASVDLIHKEFVTMHIIRSCFYLFVYFFLTGELYHKSSAGLGMCAHLQKHSPSLHHQSSHSSHFRSGSGAFLWLLLLWNVSLPAYMHIMSYEVTEHFYTPSPCFMPQLCSRENGCKSERHKSKMVFHLEIGG